MLKKKIGCLALTAMLAAGIMAGCGGEDNGGETQANGGGESPPPKHDCAMIPECGLC